jgi:hypothetical protein
MPCEFNTSGNINTDCWLWFRSIKVSFHILRTTGTIINNSTPKRADKTKTRNWTSFWFLGIQWSQVFLCLNISAEYENPRTSHAWWIRTKNCWVPEEYLRSSSPQWRRMARASALWIPACRMRCCRCVCCRQKKKNRDMSNTFPDVSSVVRHEFN